MDLAAIETALANGQFCFTIHALEQMAKRGLAEADVRQALALPEEVLPVREGRVVVHSIVLRYLLRIFVDVDRDPMEVVTAYRTSKIERYRNKP